LSASETSYRPRAIHRFVCRPIRFANRRLFSNNRRDVEGAVPYDLQTDGYFSNNRREGKPLPYGIKIPFVADKRYIIASLGSNII